MKCHSEKTFILLNYRSSKNCR
uniref:Uncharacterized protein n=1 Tax=Anguilla anguilla TaxID=7936 RepID=A0A0E9U3D1_ANGAN